MGEGRRKETLPVQGEKRGRERPTLTLQGPQLWGRPLDSPCSCRHLKNRRSHNPPAPVLSNQQSYMAPQPL